jgi:hypothetical protein
MSSQFAMGNEALAVAKMVKVPPMLFVKVSRTAMLPRPVMLLMRSGNVGG